MIPALMMSWSNKPENFSDAELAATVGKARAAHEILGEIAAPHCDPIARRGGDRGSCGPRLADQHDVPFPAIPTRGDWV